MSRDKPVFERAMLTSWVISDVLGGSLDPSKVLVGTGIAPPAGGWTGAQPGEGDFMPYVVVMTSVAAPAGRQLMGPGEAQDWTVRYSVRSVGGAHDQAEWTADQARSAWDTQPETKLPLTDTTPPARWKAYQFTLAQMGAVARNDDVNPPYWEVEDIMVLSLSRCRS